MLVSPTQKDRRVAVHSELGDDVLLLRHLTGTERLSAPFSYELEALSADPAVDLAALVGTPVAVRVGPEDTTPRWFHGRVASCAQTGFHGRLAGYRLSLRPWLWFLRHSSDCRIFQDLSVPEIVQTVFREHEFDDFDTVLYDSYRPRAYCVQYRESALHFVSRLLEEEGIYYYFRHEPDRHVLVLCDSAAGHDPVPGSEQLPYSPQDPDALLDGPRVFDWSVGLEAGPSGYGQRDFDYLAPRKSLDTKRMVSGERALPPLEVFDYPGSYRELDEGDEIARRRLEELESASRVIGGRTTSPALAAGTVFALTGHPREDQNQEYLVVGIEHEVSSNAYLSDPEIAEELDYRNELTVLEIDRQFRPPRSTEKPVLAGPQTAIVVGQQGEEIWTDAHGRVKVQFHWDRYGGHDERSSCWIRVAQGWVGRGWGALFTPRIGQEVMVDFLEGDPDRPVITGSVYNGTSPPPYELPRHGAISTLKSSSSKGGAGFNEVRFDDRQGEEQLFLHAQRNLDLRIVNDAFEWIGRNRHRIVKQDSREHIENDRHQKTDGHHVEEIGKDCHLRVEGKLASEVGASCSLTVKGDLVQAVEKNLASQVEGDAYLRATNVVIEASDNLTLRVGGSFIAIEGGGIRIGTTGDVIVESQGQTSVSGSAGAELTSGATTVVQGALVNIN